MLTISEAFTAGATIVNDRCRAAGIDPLSGKDIAIIAAHAAFDKAYRRIVDRLQPGQEAQFDRDAVAFAAKCIAEALLVKAVVS